MSSNIFYNINAVLQSLINVPYLQTYPSFYKTHDHIHDRRSITALLLH